MTHAAFVGLIFATIVILGCGVIVVRGEDSPKIKALAITIGTLIIIFMWMVVFFYFNETPQGIARLQAEMTSTTAYQPKNDITINIYDDNNKLVRRFTGKLDISTVNDYVCFEYKGKKYAYRNYKIEIIENTDPMA